MSETNSADEHFPSTGFFIALICFDCLCVIVGMLGNVGVIVYNIFRNHSKTPTTYFVMNLAISDILVCLTFFPPWIFEFISILTGKENNHKLICKIALTSSCTSIALSIANLLAITIDRCLFITKPLKYSRIMTWNRTYIFLTVIWLLAIVNANLVYYNMEEVSGRRLSCMMKNKYLGKIQTIFNIYIPLVGFFILNYKIYKVAKIQRRKIRGESFTAEEPGATGTTQDAARRRDHLQQMKMIKTFAIVLFVLVFFMFPRVIISLVHQYVCKEFCISVSVTMFFTMLMGANSVMNPIIYSARNKEYRIIYRQFISRMFRKNLSEM